MSLENIIDADIFKTDIQNINGVTDVISNGSKFIVDALDESFLSLLSKKYNVDENSDILIDYVSKVKVEPDWSTCDVEQHKNVDETTKSSDCKTVTDVSKYECKCGKDFVEGDKYRNHCTSCRFVDHLCDHSDDEDLEKSVIRSSNQTFFMCVDCDVFFPTLQELNDHTSTHVNFKNRFKSPVAPVESGNSLESKDKVTKPRRRRRLTNQIQKFCDLCGLTFETKALMMTHRKAHARSTENVCGLCGATFRTRRTLKLHLYRKHDVGDAFVCHKCDKSFALYSALLLHLENHNEDKPFICSECGKAYPSDEILQRHKKIHNKRFPCSHCNRRFMCQAQVRRHMLSVNNILQHVCQFCGKAFTSLYYLDSHMVVHATTKDYQCTWCGALFARQSQLKRHHLTHTGERSHQCTICYKSFPTINSVTKHMETHLGKRERPFICLTCGKSFSRRSHMNRHLKKKCFDRRVIL